MIFEKKNKKKPGSFPTLFWTNFQDRGFDKTLKKLKIVMERKGVLHLLSQKLIWILNSDELFSGPNFNYCNNLISSFSIVFFFFFFQQSPYIRKNQKARSTVVIPARPISTSVTWTPRSLSNNWWKYSAATGLWPRLKSCGRDPTKRKPEAAIVASLRSWIGKTGSGRWNFWMVSSELEIELY